MITYRDLVNALRTLGLGRQTPVIVHAALSPFGQVNGGVDTILGALLSTFDTLVMPVFTFRTQVIPEVGPENNGMVYGSGKSNNATAEFFRPDLPADPDMGEIGEYFRRLPQASRSAHPILSFTGVYAEPYLKAQSLADPLAPLKLLSDRGAWVILMGVDHSHNVSLHLAEQVVGRPQFVRWALTPFGIMECPNIPGCRRGFPAIARRLLKVTQQAQLGSALIQAVPLIDLVDIAAAWLRDDPLALLCDQPDCASCQAVRSQVIGV